MRPLRLACLLAALALGAGACGGKRPWDVTPNQRPRFQETRRVCHMLTHGEGGVERPEAFERCMERRGFRRKPWWEFWN